MGNACVLFEVSEEAEDVEDPENGPLLVSLLPADALDTSVDCDEVSVFSVEVESTDMVAFDSESLANETRLELERLDFGDVEPLVGKLFVVSVFFSKSCESDLVGELSSDCLIVVVAVVVMDSEPGDTD